MNKQNIIVVILSLMPSYFAIFSEAVTASILLAVATLIGIILIGVNEGQDKDLTEKLRLAWVLHLLGILVVFTYFQVN